MKPNGAAVAQIKLVPEFDDNLPFPWLKSEEERDEAEYGIFLRRVLPELLRVAKADNWLLNQIEDRKLGADYLPDILAVIQRADEALEPLWRAGTAAARERLVESLRSWWPRYMELRAEPNAPPTN